jgi:hypothetical protein
MKTSVKISIIVILILLFYFAYVYKYEGFETTPSTMNSLQQLVQSLLSQQGTLTSSQQTNVNDLINQIAALNASFQTIIEQNNVLSKNAGSSSGSGSSSEASSIEASNPMNDTVSTLLTQDNRIKQLQSRLSQLQQVYGSYLQKKTNETVKYDKIPVYSSCIIEADSSYTVSPQTL